MDPWMWSGGAPSPPHREDIINLATPLSVEPPGRHTTVNEGANVVDGLGLSTPQSAVLTVALKTLVDQANLQEHKYDQELRRKIRS